jgi:hypothetical protein
MIMGNNQAREQAEIAREGLKLDKQQWAQDLQGKYWEMEDALDAIRSQRNQAYIDARDYGTKIFSYQKWLDNYGSLYENETKSYEYAGRQQFDELMAGLGYADALAGATGRAAAGTSMAAVGQSMKQKVVGFAGDDMTLDRNGGIYGMNYERLVYELENQRLENQMQMGVYQESLAQTYRNIAAFNDAETRGAARLGELQSWIDEALRDDSKPEPSGWERFLTDVLDPLGLGYGEVITGTMAGRTDGAGNILGNLMIGDMITGGAVSAIGGGVPLPGLVSIFSQYTDWFK